MKDFKYLGSGQTNSQKDLINITQKATTVALKFELPKIIKKVPLHLPDPAADCNQAIVSVQGPERAITAKDHKKSDAT